MRFAKESFVAATPERVFSFHEQPDALQRLTPPWERTSIVKAARIAEVGSQVVLKQKLGPFNITWVAQHTRYEPPYLFEDIQVKGPFRRWQHRHIIRPADGGAVLRDQIQYEMPMGFVGRLLAPMIVERRLKRLFDYRHQVTREWCELNIS